MRFKIDNSIIEGTEAEKLFIETAVSKGYRIIRKANPDEDIYQHWDFLISKDNIDYRVDIKAHKHEYRDGPLLKDWFYIEWKNVIGNPGWIDGMADLIAFQYYNKFYIFLRNSLKDFATANTHFNKIVYNSKDCKYCIYTRKNRKDQISMINISDLLKVEHPSIWTI